MIPLLLRQLQRGGLVAGNNVEALVYRHAERAADRRGSAEHRRLCGRTEEIFDCLFNYPGFLGNLGKSHALFFFCRAAYFLQILYSFFGLRDNSPPFS